MSATLITDSSRKNAHGFTFIEIIAVLVIIGIMATVAVTIFSSLDKYKLASEVEILKTHLRYAQSRAMNDIVPWKIYFSDNKHYRLQRNGDAIMGGVISNPDLPNENNATHKLQGGVTKASTSHPDVQFDIWGSPGTSDRTLKLKAGKTRIITVTANTGFIP